MAADWEKLAADYANNDSALIAEVDCTSEETEIVCDENNVEGFPTLKFGDTVTGLEDYDGGRDYDALAAFAKEHLKPSCSPSNIDLCDDEKKAAIERFQHLPTNELRAEIAKITAEIDDIEDNSKLRRGRTRSRSCRMPTRSSWMNLILRSRTSGRNRTTTS